ncbi:transposase [Azospirillum oryzae]|uniref:transposase n=1 Tax=Azospirillum oryzae TaxID=286727 RepID=UPI001178527C|nr:transposase [Azospirillum oryzae]
MGTAVRPASTTSASWDAFWDVDAFVDEVLSELTAMAADGSRPTRSGPKPALTGAALRKAIMAIWCVCFCGMRWRAIGQLTGIPFGTLYTLFARWTRLGLWRGVLDRLRRTWRMACGDTAEPSTVVIDSRTCPSAPSCFARGVDGGKKIRGVKVSIAVEKYALPLAIDPCRPTCTTPWALYRYCANSLAAGSKVPPSAISVIGVNAWPKPRKRSASPSGRSSAAVTGCSSLPRSPGSWSAPSAGSAVTND